MFEEHFGQLTFESINLFPKHFNNKDISDMIKLDDALDTCHILTITHM